MLAIPRLEAQEDWSAVILTLKQQVRSNRGDENLRNQLAVAHNNYAMALGHQKKWEEATRQMEEALRLDRHNTRFKENLGLVHLNHAYQLYQEPTRERYYQSYRHQEAKKLVGKALGLNSKLASAYVLLGDIEYDNQQSSPGLNLPGKEPKGWIPPSTVWPVAWTDWAGSPRWNRT